MRRLLAVAALCLGALGCQPAAVKENDSADEVERNVQDVELLAKESRTLSALGNLEEGVRNYVHEEGKIPENLESLVPKYIAEIPNVELSVGRHRETNGVVLYPRSALRGGQIDGTKLRDTGGWGYVFNDRQAVVFVDCTHRASNGRAWYLQRGTSYSP